MPLINFDDVSAEYGANLIFSGVSFGLERRQRVGIVGPNGAGKSTLLRLVTGAVSPAAGRVELQRNLRIGVLDQFDIDFTADSVLEQTMTARQDLLDMRHRLHGIEQRLAGGEHDDALLHEYGEIQSAYDHGDGYTLEAQAREVLGHLGFHDEQIEQDPRQLSGGQRRRVQLAQLLLLDADVYLLDEPTNHLDLASIEWLEEYLVAAPEAMLVISHDRRFLDNVADSMLEMEAGRGYAYPGNYTKFLRLRAARRREQLRQFEVQQGYIAHQEAFIQRYKAGQRAREARGRATRLERLERVEAPPDDKEIRIRFGGPPSASMPLQAHSLVAGYPGVELARVPNFQLQAGARVAIVGPNGAGKTTLLKTLHGSLKPLAGTVGYGTRVLSSYYDQHLGDLPEEKNLVEVLGAVHAITEESARHHLARLLFRGDDVFKKVRQLSGGERSRLALARLMLDQGNLLFLDEPTNHLDVPSQEVLQDALLEFPGTVVFVSHDRELIDAVATQTWWLEEGEVRMTEGGYRQRTTARVVAPAAFRPVPPTPRSEDKPKRIGAQARAEATAERATRAAAARRVRVAEAAVEKAESRLREVEARLAEPEIYRFPMEADILAREHAQLKTDLEALYVDWTAAAQGAEADAELPRAGSN